MNKSKLYVSTIMLLTLLGFAMGGFAYADDMAAKRHMARGTAAIEDAKSPADYQDAVKEFTEAVKLAPNWADAWFNLGMAQESAGQYQAAITSFKSYLKNAPGASDADATQTRIFKLEYKAEKAQKKAKAGVEIRQQKEAGRFSGTWRNFNHEVELVSSISGCAIIDSGVGERGSNSPNEVRKADACEIVGEHLRINLRGSAGGSYPFSYSVICEYSLSADRNLLKGLRYISGTGSVSTAICDAYDFKRIY